MLYIYIYIYIGCRNEQHKVWVFLKLLIIDFSNKILIASRGIQYERFILINE